MKVKARPVQGAGELRFDDPAWGGLYERVAAIVAASGHCPIHERWEWAVFKEGAAWKVRIDNHDRGIFDIDLPFDLPEYILTK